MIKDAQCPFVFFRFKKIFASGGASLNCALLVVTNILWVSAVLLPSWFVFSIGTDKSVVSIFYFLIVFVLCMIINQFAIKMCMPPRKTLIA